MIEEETEAMKLYNMHFNKPIALIKCKKGSNQFPRTLNPNVSTANDTVNTSREYKKGTSNNLSHNSLSRHPKTALAMKLKQYK
jgi:hypothetical protein